MVCHVMSCHLMSNQIMSNNLSCHNMSWPTILCYFLNADIILRKPMDHLNLSHNRLVSIHPRVLAYVQVVDISFNNLKYIPQYFHQIVRRSPEVQHRLIRSTECSMYHYCYFCRLMVLIIGMDLVQLLGLLFDFYQVFLTLWSFMGPPIFTCISPPS